MRTSTSPIGCLSFVLSLAFLVPLAFVLGLALGLAWDAFEYGWNLIEWREGAR